MQKKSEQQCKKTQATMLGPTYLLGHIIPNVASKPLKSTKFVCGVDT